LGDSLAQGIASNPLRWINRIVFELCSIKKRPGHYTIETQSETPPGSGLGGSSVMGVSLYKALAKTLKIPLKNNLWGCQRHLRDLEAIEIAHPAGEQD